MLDDCLETILLNPITNLITIYEPIVFFNINAHNVNFFLHKEWDILQMKNQLVGVGTAIASYLLADVSTTS